MIEQIKKVADDLRLKRKFLLQSDYNLVDVEIIKTDIRFKYKRDRLSYAYPEINAYEFIFSTEIGFLDKLVGNPLCKKCGLNPKTCPTDGKMRCEKVTADYHRTQLANMTLDQMVSYISNI